MWIEAAEQMAADDRYNLNRLGGLGGVGGGRVGVSLGLIRQRQATAHNNSATTPSRARILDPQTGSGLITGNGSSS
jgi:hypothetical protein